jgi:uncharacterized membrane protein (DUF4010 family)
MVVLIAGIGLASYVALRVAGTRGGAILSGILGGLVSSTATTVLYARRAAGSPALERVAFGAVPLANLVPLARIALLTAVVSPALLPRLAPALGAALAAGVLVWAAGFSRSAPQAEAGTPEIHNPAEMGTALRFAAVYALVLLAAAWLSELAGPRGLYAAALASGIVDIDAITLSALNLFGEGRAEAQVAALAIVLAYCANTAFKLGVLFWYHRPLALRTLWPLGAALAAGGAALALA